MDDTLYTNCGTIEPPQLLEICSVQPSLEAGRIPYFHSLLCNWATAYPSLFNWVAVIDPVNPEFLKTKITQEVKGKYELTRNLTDWDIAEGYNSTFNDQTQKTVGCIFASAHSCSNESFSTETSTASRGFITSPISKDRSYPHTMDISFRETNTSFTDSVIRPWIIIGSYMGLTARANEESIKANITIYEFGKPTSDCEKSVIRKQISYYDCVPYALDGYSLEQTTSDPGIYKVSFSFGFYSVKTIGSLQ